MQKPFSSKSFYFIERGKLIINLVIKIISVILYVNFHLRDSLTVIKELNKTVRVVCCSTLYQVPWVYIVFLCIYFVYWKLPSHFMVDKLSQCGKILSEGWSILIFIQPLFHEIFNEKHLRYKSIEIEENLLNAP